VRRIFDHENAVITPKVSDSQMPRHAFLSTPWIQIKREVVGKWQCGSVQEVVA
jgi:hypothetical protein